MGNASPEFYGLPDRPGPITPLSRIPRQSFQGDPELFPEGASDVICRHHPVTGGINHGEWKPFQGRCCGGLVSVRLSIAANVVAGIHLFLQVIGSAIR